MCCRALCTIFDMCRSYDSFLPPIVAGSMLDECERFLVQYNALVHNSTANGQMHYNIATKFHLFWHICHDARFLNPKCMWTYEFEDFVGVIIKAAQGCMHGSALSLVGMKDLDKFLLIMQLRVRQ